MIDNYEIDDLGVIHQIKRKPFVYDQKYAQTYTNYGAVNIQLSNLRLGYVIGSIGKIPESILDYGYGNGDFLKVSSNTIKNCFGTDINTQPIPENCTFVDSLFGRHYEVITFFDSIEHCPDIDWMSKLDAIYICISLPWCHYFNDEWFGNWRHRKPDEHLHHFNEISLVKFMNKHGYECLNYCNLEDSIRIPSDTNKNILTAIFKKI
jgi:hypothetical protein